MTTFDLRNIRLRPGEEHREPVELQLEPLALGGQQYLPVPPAVPAQLRITKATTGTVFELSFHVRLHGPCFRCLADTALELKLGLREYQSSAPGASDDERSEYVADNALELSAWGRDAVVLALPGKILCRPDCAGLCPVCGKDLNVEPHEHEETKSDSRWSALESLREQL